MPAVNGLLRDPRAADPGLVGESGSGNAPRRASCASIEPDAGGDRRSATSPFSEMSECGAAPQRGDPDGLPGPLRSLNPRRTVGRSSPRARSSGAVYDRAAPARHALSHRRARRGSGERYPHEFSGGQRQRIGIARALALRARAAGGRRGGVGPRRLGPGPSWPVPRPPVASSTWRSCSSPTTCGTRRSWVMNRIARPSSTWRSRIRARMSAWTETSRADTASSATSTSGRTASARAMPMRWRWPPENSCG